MKFDFNEHIRASLMKAREAATRLGHDYVGTEHLLLGILDAPRSPGTDLLEWLVPETHIRARLQAAVRPGSSRVAGELPYTSRSKKTLEFAMTEARQLGDRLLGPEHLLLGLLREEKGIAAQVLTSLGVTVERVRELVTAGGVPSSPFRIVIDDAAELSIYEQIMARVQEGVATGELRPGERLPPVRTLADELDIAPGTVARAYAELERLGVVVTEGARGTRIADAQPAGRSALDPGTLAGLLRPVAVAAFHMGAGAADLRRALEDAMTGIFDQATSQGDSPEMNA